MANIFQCPLFKGLTESEIQLILDAFFSMKSYAPGVLVAVQGDRYEALIVVSEGRVVGEMTDSLGRNTVIEEIAAPRVVAPAFLYATENRLPVSILTVVRTELFSIPRKRFTEIMQNDSRLLGNFLQMVADRSCFLSDKLRMQRFGTIKSKLAKHLLELSGKQNSSEFFVVQTQQELADLFGVTRPALARCIRQMQDEKIIASSRRQFRILDVRKLKDFL